MSGEKRPLVFWPRFWFERVIAVLGGIWFFVDPAWYGIGPTPLSARFEAGVIAFFFSWLLAILIHRGHLLIRNLFHRRHPPNQAMQRTVPRSDA